MTYLNSIFSLIILNSRNLIISFPFKNYLTIVFAVDDFLHFKVKKKTTTTKKLVIKSRKFLTFFIVIFKVHAKRESKRECKQAKKKKKEWKERKIVTRNNRKTVRRICLGT